MEEQQSQTQIHQLPNPDAPAVDEVESETDLPSRCPAPTQDPDGLGSSQSKSSFNQQDIVKALEVVERDSVAIAQSFSTLFDSLRLALSEVTSVSVDHMQCFGEAAGRLQESVLDAATKGNRYINSCLRLNDEMKGIDGLAAQLKMLKRNVDALDTAVNKLLPPP